jgi:hypothetical protein
MPPNTSLQQTRLAGRKRARALPAGVRDNGSDVARAAGQLSSMPLGGHVQPNPQELHRRRACPVPPSSSS